MAAARADVAFALVYLTFFLDNVLLTVLVPIIPDWVRGAELARWAQEPAPLAALLNATVRHATAAGAGNLTDPHANTLAETALRGGSTAAVGAVLGAKAATQLLAAPWAARAASLGPARALAAGSALLAGAAAALAACGGALCAGAGRALHGAGSALAGVAGLALVAAVAPDRLPTLLGAVALGVLVGYPAGGLLAAAPSFLLLAGALLANLALQYVFLQKEEFNRPTACAGGVWRGARAAAAAAPAAACAGCVLLTTAVMAALEPTLPPWMRERFHPQRWQTGAVFVPDSAGYLAATALAGAAARAAGAERVALAGQLAVGLAAIALPSAPSVWWLAAPHGALGAGLGAADAALLPALLARARSVPPLAALLQAASSAAYAIGPALGGVLAWRAGFPTALRALGAANLLYAAFLYTRLRRHPLSPQWGATTPEESEAEEAAGDEGTPLRPLQYVPLH